MKLRNKLFLSVAPCLAAAAPAAAQTTNIQSSTGALNLGTNVATAGSTVTITGGTTAGANLFHSFSNFDLASGATARWEAAGGQANGILNLVNRMTGANPARISGRLDTTSFTNANFYFLSPAGVIFGPGAVLSIPNAVHFSTASGLNFAGGSAFTMTTASGSSFSIAAPESFGFIGARGDVSLTNASDSFAINTRQLHLSGRNLTLSDTFLQGARMDLIAAGAGDLTLSIADPLANPVSGAMTIGTGGFVVGRTGLNQEVRLRTNSGSLSLTGSQLGTFGTTTDGVGTLLVRANSLVMSGGALLGLEARDVSGGHLDIDVVSGVSLSGGADIIVRTAGAGDAPSLTLRAGSMSLIGSSLVDGRNLAGSTGAAGDLDMTVTGTVLLRGGSRLSASTLNNAPGGDVRLIAGRLDAAETSRVESSTLASGNGPAGDLHVEAGEIFLRGGSTILSQVLGGGQGGDIFVKANSIAIANTGSAIAANCFGDTCTGNAGNLTI